MPSKRRNLFSGNTFGSCLKSHVFSVLNHLYGIMAEKFEVDYIDDKKKDTQIVARNVGIAMTQVRDQIAYLR